jgi:hypothetical protein
MCRKLYKWNILISKSYVYDRGSQPFLTHGTLYYFLKICRHPIAYVLYSIVYKISKIYIFYWIRYTNISYI